MRAVAVLVLLAGVLAGCKRAPESPVQPVGTAEAAPAASAQGSGALLLLSADTRGYLGPCGCSENMRGGIDRAAFAVEQARKSGLPLLYIDGGDSLFGEPTLKPAQVPQEERKAQALAESMKRMGLAVRATGELDDVRGVAFRQGLGLPELPPGGVKLLPAGARQVGVVAAQSVEQLTRGSAQARKEGADFVVALFHGTVEQVQAAADQPGLEADLILATHTATEFSGEEHKLVRAAVPVVGLQSKGRELLRVDLGYGPRKGRFSQVKSQGDTEREVALLDQRLGLLNKEINLPGIDPQLHKAKQAKLEELVARKQKLLTEPVEAPAGTNSFSLRFLPLESTLLGQPDVLKVVQAYDRDVGQMNLAWAREHGEDCPAPKKGEAAFVGNGPCQDCHAEAMPVWEHSKHAHGWTTLEEKGKQFHLNCVGCHVTGYEKPGGVCRLDKVAGREGVGCESCHGPGSLHSEEPTTKNIVRNPGNALCVTCHNPENSPHFDYATYLPRILGPGHGQPAAGK
ncbi:multiheme c-type cytochrome [Hyalangium gracile]|uniref:multiheme c-type cytochrome n=1 Tax=Hyalangium gracile TaxID=394092 RepID=UPI001CCA8D80|nr:multiheme c-type cytochrome [Hyalangium gracile]